LLLFSDFLQEEHS